jgi:hypothetical protein
MPIKDQSIYPPYWKQFSLYIRKERAKDRCEQCTARNGYLRVTTGRITKIVLTVAHLDYDGGPCDCKARTGRKCARPNHVKALCQRCHLAMDMPHHIANRQKSLAEKKDAGRHLFSEIV